MPKRRRSSDSSRRNFLKAAGFVGAAAATVRPATPALSRPLRSND